MKKVVLLILVVLALGLVPMAGHADCTDAAIGKVCESNGVITADGNADNPDPIDGFVSVDTNNGRVCADDNGSPEQSDSPTCAP